MKKNYPFMITTIFYIIFYLSSIVEMFVELINGDEVSVSHLGLVASVSFLIYVANKGATK